MGPTRSSLPMSLVLFGYVAIHLALFIAFLGMVALFHADGAALVIPVLGAIALAMPYIAVSGLWTAGMTPLWLLGSRPKDDLRTWTGFADEPLLISMPSAPASPQ